MGFGYKTAWIAVRGRTPDEVADALGLADRRPMAYAEGTHAAYGGGAYVAAPLRGWILAHGPRIARGLDLASAKALEWLSDLSKSLGVGLLNLEPDMDSWSEEQREAWYDESMPGEHHVMRIAGLWSVDPTSFEDDEVTGLGIYGVRD